MRDSAGSAKIVALTGFAALAAAMGIGRFAFTPLLPMMQAAGELTLEHGAWLASANYAGYLAGAVLCGIVPPRPRDAIRIGLVSVALLTAAMAFTSSLAIWLVLRFVAGAASAVVLVGVSVWALGALGALGRAGWAGWVYAGVGGGIAAAGLLTLAAGVAKVAAAPTWIGLGVVAGVIAALAWRPLAAPIAPGQAPQPPAAGGRARGAVLIACYASLGYGYIIPATFLPAMARERIADPAVFGWVWPVFGATAALSTVIVAACFPRASPRARWSASLVLMAAGVAVPLVADDLAALVLAAVLVGGTFMVATMAGLQEARRVAGPHAPRMVAAMTAAFALGQLAGPLVVGWAAASGAQAYLVPVLVAALWLLASAAYLWRA